MNILDAIRRIGKRTERDLAFAGAMVGSVQAMSKLFPVMEGYSTLWVTFYTNDWQSWVCAPVAREACPWRDFLKWYHGRPQSASYVMRHTNGQTMFNRKDVRGYEIKWAEREKAA